MALKVWDGLDHYGSTADMAARSGFLQYQNLSGSLGTGRNGNGKRFNGGASAVFGQRVATAGVGFVMSVNSAASTTSVVVSFDDTIANANQVTVNFRADNYCIEVWRNGIGGTLLTRTANNAFAGMVDNFVEIWLTINGSTGSVGIHINGASVVNLTSVNTQQTANASWDRFNWTLTGFDDFYYADSTTGPGTNPCNTFIGDPRVYTLFPNANAVVAFTPLAGTNWQEVSEIAMDSDTSYNSSSTVTNEDLFTTAGLPATVGFIFGLEVTGAYRKDDAGLRQIKQALKSGATEVYGTQNNLSDTVYFYFTDPWILDPNTSANWTRTNLNAADIGYNLAA